MCNAVRFVALVSLLVSGLSFGSEDEPYRWPLDLPRVLTSSFGEYRPAGYHMGIDLRTGPVGQDVFAPASGYVERIRCSPYGYGKAIYFRLDDGHTFVYAHLNDYAEVLRNYVRGEQHRRERYEVDLYPDKDAFRFARGDLIAYSGQTGIGAPHLHFETRDSAGVPVDPRTLGFEWPDRSPPTIHGVAVEPASPETSINGEYVPVILSPRSSAGTLVTDPVHASGPIHFAVSAIDTDAAGTRLGISSALLSADDQDAFQLRFSRIPYGVYGDGAVAFHPYLTGRNRYLTLWRWPGNRVPAYTDASGSGTVDAEYSRGAVIHVRDELANERTIRVPIALTTTPEIASPKQVNVSIGTIRFQPVATWVVCIVRFSADEAEVPMARIEGGTVATMPMVRVSRREFQLPIVPASDADRLEVIIDHPRVAPDPADFAVLHRGKQPPVYEQAGVRIEGTANSAFGTLLVSAKRVKRQTSTELQTVGDAFSVWNEYHPIAEPLRITFPVPAGTDLTRVDVYRHGSGWSRQKTVKSADGLTIETRHLGLFQAFEDRHAPYLNVTSPPPNYHSKTRRPILKARVADAHSGVDGFGATANGKWLLVAYDPEHGELRWDRDEDLPSGPQVVEFWASDHAGNVNRKQVTVVVP